MITETDQDGDLLLPKKVREKPTLYTIVPRVQVKQNELLHPVTMTVWNSILKWKRLQPILSAISIDISDLDAFISVLIGKKVFCYLLIEKFCSNQ